MVDSFEFEACLIALNAYLAQLTRIHTCHMICPVIHNTIKHCVLAMACYCYYSAAVDSLAVQLADLPCQAGPDSLTVWHTGPAICERIVT